ncbi:MAG: hypothetical protein E7051_10065 [Lentisphaerae bacterium]|nr:hypothetical protein [Lentisphaerota bacterium]
MNNPNMFEESKKSEKKNGNRSLFITGTVLALLCFIFGSTYGCIRKWGDGKDAPTPSIEKIQKFQKHVKDLRSQYGQKNLEALARFENKIAEIGKVDFQQARANVSPTVKQFAEFKNCGILIFLMARDKVSKTETAQEFINGKIEQSILKPCCTGAGKMQEELQNFILELQENNNNFSSACLNEIKALPDGTFEYDARKTFVNGMYEFEGLVTDMAVSKTLTTAGVALEVILWRQTFNAIMRLAGKTIAKMGVSAAAVVADGPLPIGDILAVAGAAWCVYDVYNICKVLPEEMALCLNTAIDSCENNYRQETLAKARMLLEKSCAAMDESMKEIAEAE